MTPRQFKAAIRALGLSQGQAARLCYPGIAKKWASGGRKVPAPVAIILRLMLAGELTVEQLERVGARK